MALVDTHCHLYSDPLAGSVDAVLERAADRGVARVIVPAYDLSTWDEVTRLADRPGVFAAWGLHPWVAASVAPDELKALLAARLSGLPRPVGVGEIGLDTKLDPDGPDLATQLAVLRPQLELADDLALPVILHCRGAFEELLSEVARFGGRLRGVLHAWSRGPELADRFVTAGLALGLGGALTRPQARRVHRSARRLPLEAFVLETDAPSIGLDGVPPENTEPGHVADVAIVLAALRDEPVETIAEVTTGHAERLFQLPA